jgi:hypothetical protein
MLTQCDEKIRLMNQSQEATDNYAQAVADLKRQVGKSSKEKFEQLVQATKEARDCTNQACLNLARHVCSVRCIFTLRE